MKRLIPIVLCVVALVGFGNSLPLEQQAAFFGVKPPAPGGGGGGGPVDIVDDFSRANADPLSSPTSDGLGTWLTPVGNWQQIKLSGNAIVGHAGSGFSAAAKLSSPTFNADQTNKMIVGPGAGQGVGVRMTNSSGLFVKVFSSSILAVYEGSDNGVPPDENLKPFWTGLTINSGSEVVFYVTGNVFGVQLDGSAIGFYTNNTYVSGQPFYVTQDAVTITHIHATSPAP